MNCRLSSANGLRHVLHPSSTQLTSCFAGARRACLGPSPHEDRLRAVHRVCRRRLLTPTTPHGARAGPHPKDRPHCKVGPEDAAAVQGVKGHLQAGRVHNCMLLFMRRTCAMRMHQTVWHDCRLRTNQKSPETSTSTYGAPRSAEGMSTATHRVAPARQPSHVRLLLAARRLDGIALPQPFEDQVVYLNVHLHIVFRATRGLKCTGQ